MFVRTLQLPYRLLLDSAIRAVIVQTKPCTLSGLSTVQGTQAALQECGNLVLDLDSECLSQQSA